MSENATVIFTEGRLKEMGWQGPTAPFLVLELHEYDYRQCWFDDLRALIEWALREKPANLHTRTLGTDIDCDVLVDLLRGRLPIPGETMH